MNTKLILILILFAGTSSCTTMYKSGQTPDDVYYSPAIPQNDYVSVTNEEDRNTYDGDSYEDRELRRRINNRRLRVYNDYGYNYPVYNYPYGYNYPYSPYGYNYPYSYYSWYSPFYVNPTIGKSPSIYTGPRKYNLGAYGNTTNNITYKPDSKTGSYRPATVPVRTFTNSATNPSTNRNNGVGNFIRRVFTSPPGNINTYSTTDNSSQNRTYQPVRSTSSTTITNSSPASSNNSSSNVPARSFRK